MLQARYQYHLWFNLKPDVSAAIALATTHSFLSGLLESGEIAAFRILRNAAAPPNTILPRYLALIDFTDRDHFSSAFANLRRDGIHQGAHGELMRMIADFRAEFTEIAE